MILDRVTITGADESVDPYDLAVLSAQHPWVEWGILFGSKDAAPRFPGLDWCRRLLDVCDEEANAGRTMRLSAHLCGRWVRDLVEQAKFTFRSGEHASIYERCQRVQLNFHGQYHRAHADFVSRIRYTNRQFILQHDGTNDGLIGKWAGIVGVDVAPLFDLSGGAGVLPASWPKAVWNYQGYAGGLSPENVAEQLGIIKDVAGDRRVWIDVETRVRSADDLKFDLAKVASFIKASEPFVSKEERAGASAR